MNYDDAKNWKAGNFGHYDPTADNLAEAYPMYIDHTGAYFWDKGLLWAPINDQNRILIEDASYVQPFKDLDPIDAERLTRLLPIFDMMKLEKEGLAS